MSTIFFSVLIVLLINTITLFFLIKFLYNFEEKNIDRISVMKNLCERIYDKSWNIHLMMEKEKRIAEDKALENKWYIIENKAETTKEPKPDLNEFKEKMKRIGVVINDELSEEMVESLASSIKEKLKNTNEGTKNE